MTLYLFLECPASVNIVPIVIGIVFGILLIGIALLLLWWLLARLAVSDKGLGTTQNGTVIFLGLSRIQGL